MVILGEEETWEAAHKAMDKADFLKRLNQIFYIDITKAIKFSLQKYIKQTKFKVRDISLKSAGAAMLAEWVLNLEKGE